MTMKSGEGAKERVLRVASCGLGLLVGWGALTGLPEASADYACSGPYAYGDLDAQLDEVHSEAAFDCLAVEYEMFEDEQFGTISLRLNVANACGEDIAIAMNLDEHYGEPDLYEEIVAEGETLRFGGPVRKLDDEKQGNGVAEIRAIPASERTGEEMGFEEYRAMASVHYSFSGTPTYRDPYDESGCDPGPMFGCAVASSGPQAPSSWPLVWVALGVVGVRRRVRERS
ncbi:hypothetical protein FRC91_01840 [Bradymonadales bacterium TMQ1]|nr:hypothetical protein FRC91_01840 [Bradymonadales bacterium TMQ1]